MTLQVQTLFKLQTRSTISLLPLLLKETNRKKSDDSFFLSPTDKYEIVNIISSLDSNKSAGPNNLPTKILKLLKSYISTQLSNIFNISFSTGFFPSMLKIAKVVPIGKKYSKLDYSNYRPTSILSSLEKKLEKLMYHSIYP